jgi:hypothetical protein
MLLGASHKMLKRILSLVFNYENVTRVEEKSSGRSKSARETLASTETGSVQSGGSIHSGSNQTEILPFPDPWDGDWNDAVINWAMWHKHENTKRESEGQEPTEVGETETD